MVSQPVGFCWNFLHIFLLKSVADRINHRHCCKCSDVDTLRSLASEGRKLEYFDSPAYAKLSRVIDIVDQSANIVRSYFADRYNTHCDICFSY